MAYFSWSEQEIFNLLRRFQTLFRPSSPTKTNLMRRNHEVDFKAFESSQNKFFLSKINRSGDTKMTKCIFSHKKSNQNQNEIWAQWDGIVFPPVKNLRENCLPFQNPMNFTA